ncbi:MAG: hypothetical protein ACKO6N_01715 [Myxococcota bacterium]
MLNMKYIDQMIEALLAHNREQAIFMVQEFTGSSRRHALEVVQVLLEELESADQWTGELVSL